nr:HAMP domain-containing sensor histidine kinase [uncultured Agathobaculum sp.]
MWWLLAPSIILFAGAFALAVELSLSLVRNLKNRTFVERSFLLRAVRWCWRTAKRICRWGIDRCKALRDGVSRGKDNLWQKSFQNYKTRKVLMLFLGYSVVLAFLAWLLGVSLIFGLCFLMGIAWVYAAIWFLIRRIDGFDRVVDALKRLRGGDLTYKLTDMPAGVFAAMADDINSLGDGMQLALQNEVRAERMKSELITNVSHDLKTPLTSILNYSDLLCQEHLTPEEANDYAKIIYQKGLRLKNLTSDLFDISKVQSGAEQVICERLDACTLVRQALGEQDKAIGDGGLTLKVDMPDHEVPVWADGKKMSRVMENLIGNCVKYAMPGTRVFLSVVEREGSAVLELKNIANYAMDFDASEITERFVRGDAARSTEGSGLGLAIAKSYVEACGGSFAVSVDGDLFKVQITFAIQP